MEVGRNEAAAMVNFLKTNKAVIAHNFDDGNCECPYSHCLIIGISKKVIRKNSVKKTRVKAFLKVVIFNPIMSTRYTLDVDLRDVVTVGALQSKDKKVMVCKETRRVGD